MVKEISMLQLEISRLRSRFKALDEAMLSQKADNAKMIVESAPTSLIGKSLWLVVCTMIIVLCL